MKHFSYKIISASLILFSAAQISSQEQSDQDVLIPHLFTYIDSPVAEQRQILTHSQIESMNAENLTSLFQAAGIQTLSYGAYGLESKPSIRGFTDETVRVVIDGVCVNNPQYGTFDFSSLNVSDIEQIEIVRGGFTENVQEEGAVGGVIIIKTKRQKLGKHFSSNSYLKSFFNAKVPCDTISQSLSFDSQLSENTFLKTSVKGTFAQNKYQFKNYFNKLKTREHSQVKDANLDFNLSHFFGNGNSWNISNISYAGYKETPGTMTSSQQGLQQDYDNNLSFAINFPSLPHNINHSDNFSWLSNTRFYEDDFSDSKHYLQSFSLNSTTDFNNFSSIKFCTGTSFNYFYLNSTDDGIHPLLSGTFKETSKFYLNKYFAISLPLAFSFSGKNYAFIPKIGFKADFKFADLILNAYRMIQFPNMDDLYWNGSGYHGNPDLKPEDGFGGEFNINLKNNYIPVSFSVFSNYYENKIQWSGTSPQNISSAFYLGFNANSNFQFLKYFSASTNIEYLYTRLLDKNNELTYGKRIMWTPDLVQSFILSFSNSFLSISIEENYTGKKYISNLNTSYVDSYFLFNLNLSYKINEKINPYLRLDNIFNESYFAVPDYPMPVISLTFGLKANF